MIQLIIGLVVTIFSLLGAIFFQWSRGKSKDTLLQNAETKKEVATGDQQIKDLKDQTEKEKKDVSKDDLLDFLDSDHK